MLRFIKDELGNGAESGEDNDWIGADGDI